MRIEKSRSGSRGPRRVGFTLIELLVVVAVIAILAALTMPALLKAIGQSQSVRCKSNLHQIGAALMGYIRDYDGLLPASDDSESRIIDQGQWWRTAQGMMVPYLTDYFVFQCPSDSGLASVLGGARWWSYGWNSNYYNTSSGSWRGTFHRNVNYVEMPTRAITFLDHVEADGGVDGNSDRPYQDAVVNSTTAQGMKRHNGGFNALFLDGHVDNFRPGPDTSKDNFEWGNVP